MFPLNIPRFHKWHLPDTDQSLVPSGVLYPTLIGDEQESKVMSLEDAKLYFDHNIIYKRRRYVSAQTLCAYTNSAGFTFFKLVAFSPL